MDGWNELRGVMQRNRQRIEMTDAEENGKE